MRAFVAVVRVEDGKVAKLMDFDDEGSATAHVGQYGGFVAANPGGSFEFWKANAAAKTLTHDSAAEDAATTLRAAQAVLEAWDAKGFTRAWESAMAPIEAEDDVGEYDANVLAEKRAARAVVVG